MLYAVHYDGTQALIEVSYSHSTTPTFTTILVKGEKKEYLSGHPRKNGVTHSNNWSIDPEIEKGADW